VPGAAHSVDLPSRVLAEPRLYGIRVKSAGAAYCLSSSIDSTFLPCCHLSARRFCCVPPVARSGRAAFQPGTVTPARSAAAGIPSYNCHIHSGESDRRCYCRALRYLRHGGRVLVRATVHLTFSSAYAPSIVGCRSAPSCGHVSAALRGCRRRRITLWRRRAKRDLARWAAYGGLVEPGGRWRASGRRRAGDGGCGSNAWRAWLAS